MREDIRFRTCKRCGKNKTVISNSCSWKKIDGTVIKYSCALWHKNDNGWLCHNCYYVLNGSAKQHWIKTNSRRNKFRLYFLGKRVVLGFEIRKHICDICGWIGKTHIHHEVYWPIMIWVGVRELCPKHHGKRGDELGQLKTFKKK